MTWTDEVAENLHNMCPGCAGKITDDGWTCADTDWRHRPVFEIERLRARVAELEAARSHANGLLWELETKLLDAGHADMEREIYAIAKALFGERPAAREPDPAEWVRRSDLVAWLQSQAVMCTGKPPVHEWHEGCDGCAKGMAIEYVLSVIESGDCPPKGER